ncbi:MAG TPA: nucleotide exchange factor GrpE [Opitutae bacterium]|nr:nucleotide exchange factor GrpE [Opitutaceae bacterium]HCR31605.1 nucleotide exchange factor GrpE [Opitutae bacterium]
METNMAEKEEEVDLEAEEAESEANLDEALPDSGQSEEESAESQISEEAPDKEEELSIEEQLDKAKKLADENYNNYLRAVADLDTYKRRVIREKDDLRQYAVSGLLESILPIYDNMALGLSSAEQVSDPKIVEEGIRMVLAQFKAVLSENGIEEIEPGQGDAFDHNLHEAVQTQPSDDVEAGAVLQLIRKGFSLNGRLIRPATVIVSGDASD